LYVGAGDGVHVFDLDAGERKLLAVRAAPTSGLALTEDGARLFAVGTAGIDVIDTRTGARTVLVGPGDMFRAAPVTDSAKTSGGFVYPIGCVIDTATHSLITVDYTFPRVARLRGVDV
jgi:hypothetical protein